MYHTVDQCVRNLQLQKIVLKQIDNNSDVLNLIINSYKINKCTNNLYSKRKFVQQTL